MKFAIGDKIKVVGLKNYQGNGLEGYITSDRGNDIYGVELGKSKSFALYEAKNLKSLNITVCSTQQKNTLNLPPYQQVMSINLTYKIGDLIELNQNTDVYQKGDTGTITGLDPVFKNRYFIQYDKDGYGEWVWSKDFDIIEKDTGNGFYEAQNTTSKPSNTDYCTCTNPQTKIASSAFSGFPTLDNTYVYCTVCGKDKERSMMSAQERLDIKEYIERKGNI